MILLFFSSLGVHSMQSESRGIAVLHRTKCWGMVVFVQWYVFLVRRRDRRGSDVFLLSISKHWPVFRSVLKDGHCSFCLLPLPAGIGRVWVWVEFSMPLSPASLLFTAVTALQGVRLCALLFLSLREMLNLSCKSACFVCVKYCGSKDRSESLLWVTFLFIKWVSSR